MMQEKGETVQKFYQELASDYDLMTGFRERIESERKTLAQWKQKYSFHSVLDAACGTGLHAILLAGMGIETVGADISPEMLSKARENAEDLRLKVEWVQSPLHQLDQFIEKNFDFIFCLGNSIPHVIRKNQLKKTFQNFYQLLKPKGAIAIQLLNFTRILQERNRIVNIRKIQEKEYIRFYDFLNKTLRFNILTIDWSRHPVGHTLHNTELFPYRAPELLKELKQAGFVRTGQFGNMSFGIFDSKKSPNLVIVAHKR